VVTLYVTTVRAVVTLNMTTVRAVVTLNMTTMRAIVTLYVATVRAVTSPLCWCIAFGGVLQRGQIHSSPGRASAGGSDTRQYGGEDQPRHGMLRTRVR
jgi:hypothetical protein